MGRGGESDTHELGLRSLHGRKYTNLKCYIPLALVLDRHQPDFLIHTATPAYPNPG
jgi:hypothetical protein